MEEKVTEQESGSRKQWKRPEITNLGKIEDVTQKSVGAFDGVGLENVEHHPSM